MTAAPLDPRELDALLKLLDDETPAVRERVSQRIGCCGGDLSEWLAEHPRSLNAAETAILSGMLKPARREALVRDWIVPSGGASALGEDWDSFEALLRILSDFLHDGVSLRQPLSDALDLLAEEAGEAGVTSSMELNQFLFESDRIRGNIAGDQDPRNSDLAWCLAEGSSNPLGLGLIFILVAKRLGLEVEGVNFPGHFLCRIVEEGQPLIIDCFDRGRIHLQSTLLEAGSDLSRKQKEILRQSADPGSILLRLLNQLIRSLEHQGDADDVRLIEELKRSL